MLNLCLTLSWKLGILRKGLMNDKIIQIDLELLGETWYGSVA
jgi:hypothetical protein